MRRHATRLVLRLSIVLLADLGVLLLLEQLASALVALTTSGTVLHGRLALIAAPTQFFFIPRVLLALLATGTYIRRSRLQSSMRVLRGSLLAALLVVLSRIPVDHAHRVFLLFPLWSAFIWCGITVARAASEWSLNLVFTGARLAAPAVVIGAAGRETVPGEEGTPLPDRDYRVVATLPTELFERDAPAALSRLGALIDEHRAEAVVAPRHLGGRELEATVDVCLTAGCELLYSARTVQVAEVRPRVVWLGEEPFFEFGTPELHGQELIVKRCLDVVGAMLALAVLSPALVLAAVAIKLDSRGPVLFSQYRAGLGGRRFRMYKFRTMRCGADDEKSALAHLNQSGDPRLFKIPNDPRITRVGAFLRRWSLDELPQIWNVLRGDMSLVGPRPFFESDLEDYEVHHYRRLSARPGLTGLWQVSGRSSVIDFEEVVRLDRQYIEQWSIWLDLSILLRTLPAVLSRSGAC